MSQDKLRLEAAAAHLDMSVHSLRRKSQNKEIPHEKYMGRLYFKVEDLDKYIDKNTKKASTAL